MKKIIALFLVALLGTVASLWGQETPPVQGSQQQEAPAEPAAAPRVLGQAQSQVEAEAWMALSQSTGKEEEIQLTERFLADYPNSGLTAFAHYSLANLYRQMNDIEKFIMYGEKALVELPDLPDVLAYLSFYYAEKGQNPKAIQSAERALELIETMAKPDQINSSQWAARKFELTGEANYALGRVYLARATGREGDVAEQNLTKAVEHLTAALDQTPDHPYAGFRLGEAYTQKQEYDKSIEAYARTVALGGVIGDYAKTKLQTVYEHVHQNTDGMDKLVEEQGQLVQQKLAERKQMLEAIVDEEAPAASPLALPGSQPPPPPPPSSF
jgi:tetratricopeptide (TPR) repeat protein